MDQNNSMITANLTIESPPTSVIRPNGHSHTDTITFHAVGNAGDSNIRHERKGTQSSVSSSNEETSAEYEGGTKNGQHTHAIVLIGLRGVGKSTLALMASAALKFKYVGVENCVRDYTGMPEALYLNKVSLDEYKDLQYRLITQSLTENEHKNSIYVLPSSSIDNVKVVEFLQKNAKKYCIINIECEELRILNYMEYSNDMEKGIQMIQAKVLKYRSIANFNFFNLHSDLTMIQRNLISIGNTDNNSEEDEDEDTNQHHHHLLLKPLEREFVQFLTFIIKGSNSASTISGDLHLKLSIDKKFSSCLQIRYPQVLNLNFWDNIDEIIYGVDALEVKIDIILLTRQINNAYAIVKLEEFIAQLKRITNCSLPIVLSIHNSISDINQFTHGSSEAIKSEVFNYYYNFLYSISKLAMDYITLDLGLFVPDTNHDSTIVMDHLNKIKGNTKIIGSFTSQDPDFWSIDDDDDESGSDAIENDEEIKINGLAIVELSRKLKLNYLRLNSFATRLSDNFKIFKFNQFVSENYPNLTISTFNNNELGKFSKICNKFLTPVDIPISSNPSLVSSQIHQALYSSFLLPSLKFYIMGRDVSNSLSPVIHNTAYKALGLPHTYATFECSTLMPYLAELVKSPNFGGTAIIMPFKLEALKYVDSMSNHVKIIGALNSIVAERSFENPNQITCIRGENTDWLGVRLSLIDNISPINAVSKNKTALVLGAGGMSRSAIYALIQLGYQRILLYNRTFNKAQDLANYYNSLSPIRPSSSLSTGEYDSNIDDLKYFEIILLNDDEFNGGIIPNNFNYPTIIISCVPSSDRITGQPTNIQFSPNWFKSPSGGVVLETGYEPLITPILQRAKQYKDKGWVSVNGLNYLYAQALAQFEMFTNKPAPRALMKSVVIEHYKTNYA